jgi:hypothetical protein
MSLYVLSNFPCRSLYKDSGLLIHEVGVVFQEISNFIDPAVKTLQLTGKHIIEHICS